MSYHLSVCPALSIWQMGTLSREGKGSQKPMGTREENREKSSQESFHLAGKPGAHERVRCLWQTFKKPGDKIQQTHAQEQNKRNATAAATVTLFHFVSTEVISFYSTNSVRQTRLFPFCRWRNQGSEG